MVYCRLFIKLNMFETEDKRLENIQSAIRLNLPELKLEHGRLGRCLIVGGGPSLKQEVKKIKKMQSKGGMVISVNGSHDYLLDHGIRSQAFVMADSRQFNARFVNRAKLDTAYYIAADCHPDVFEALKEHDLRVWFPLNYEHLANTRFCIGGGSTVGLRAINIGYAIGYRDFHLFGFDGCMRGGSHAYEQTENTSDDARGYFYGDEIYVMTEWMVEQAQNFSEFMASYGDTFKLKVHSEGIIKRIGETLCQPATHTPSFTSTHH